ncbi:MAG: GlsB/YeaQ/YmgE family stress response membrane protein [Novosphingobium sp.]|nr:GlsB/YeaQ/YmgE family stress response membrane protein [Novosphingobium sp.]MCP5379681.1 GlsB/YeaQ/YmgE family stress response membrane protein [Novosphingobium sp.]
MVKILSAIISGLIVGALARWFYPGRIDISMVMTILLGIGGAVVASLVTTRGEQGLSQVGCVSSVLGAMALIFLGQQFL